MTDARLGPAAPDEGTVYGARRPGYPADDPPQSAVEDWIQAVREREVRRVCCLLDDDQLSSYDDLLGCYRDAFGSEMVRHAPIEDYGVVSRERLHDGILPFLREADDAGERVVVHCSAGIGRTGHVLALWLVLERGYDLDEAIEAVRSTGRRPLEGEKTRADLEDRLDDGTDRS